MDFSAIKTLIQQNIRNNNNEDITGSVLQNVLLSIIDTLGDNAINDLATDLDAEKVKITQIRATIQDLLNGGYLFAGIADPAVSPGTPLVSCFYIATEAGTYTNFLDDDNDPIVISYDALYVLTYEAVENHYWECNKVSNLGDGVFDISAYHNGQTYATLSDALGTNGNNVPPGLRKGGMSVKFVQNNKYVKWRLRTNSWSTTVSDWVEEDGKIVSAVSARVAKPIIENGKVTFLQNSGLNIWYSLNYPYEYIEFNEETTFEFDNNKSERLIVRNGDIILTDGASLIDDIRLLQYSSVIHDFTGGWLYEQYLNNRVENIEDAMYRKNLVCGKAQAKSYDNWYIRYSDDVWRQYNDGLTKKLYVLPVNGGEYMSIKRVVPFPESLDVSKKVYFLRSIPDFSSLAIGDIPDFCDSIQYIEASDTNGEYVNFITPLDCRCVVNLCTWNNPSIFSGVYTELYEGQVTKNTNDIAKNTNDIALIGSVDIPFESGSYKLPPVTNLLQYIDSSNRLRMEFPLKKDTKFYIKDSAYQIRALVLYKTSIPTTIAQAWTLDAGVLYINEYSEYFSVYDRMMVVLRKSDDTDISDTKSVDDILGIDYYNDTPKITKKIKMSGGTLSSATGLYPRAIEYYLGYNHSPKFIKTSKPFTVKTLGSRFSVYWYDSNQEFLSIETFENFVGEHTVYPIYGASLFRIVAILDYVEVEFYADDYEEQYQKLPVDSGYQNVTFIVDIDVCDQPSGEHSEVTRQYIKSTDSGVLHLPSSYKHDGKPTPLIIYIHGQADRYTVLSTRFATNNRYAPEWDAAGYAQLDIDLIPDFYNYTGTGFACTSDDMSCIEAAYEWCINHFNIARDGVYLIGRSRGAQAVLQILGKSSLTKLPVLCAISNAGANTLVNYELWGANSAEEWELFCTAYGLPSEGRPAYTSKPRNDIGTPISNSDIADFLREHIDIWWDKIMTGLPMLAKYPEITEDPDRTYPTDKNDFHLKLYDLIVRSYKLDSTNPNRGKEFCDWLKMCIMRSPIPFRFDWCHGDQTQNNWDVANNNMYGYAEVCAFLNDRIGGMSVYRYWPEAGVNKPQDEPTTNPHWHELMNYYDGDYMLPNGVTVHNPSMARLEWLLWCQRHDRRYNGSVQPGGVS